MRNNQRKGVLDIGSNTIKLKIFDKDVLVLSKVYPVQIGKGLVNNVISTDKLIEIQNCLNQVNEVLQVNDAFLKKVFGTSALRDASNASLIENMISDSFHIPLEVIPGDQEAKLIYQGVRKGMLNESQKYLICDIGGGSVELIYCTNEKMIKAQSFEIGVIKLFRLKKTSDPYDENDLLYYFNHLESVLEEFLSTIKTNHLVGAAGSFESIYTLINGKEFPGKFIDIPLQDLKGSISGILKSSQNERDENQLIPIERKIFLPLGAIIVNYLINRLEINKFTVSPNSLIEGIELE